MLAPFHLPLGLALAREAVAWGLVFTAMGGAVGLLSRGLGACAGASAP